MNLRLIAVSAVAFAGSVLAGAWDTGPFDNDDALDWVWELTDSDDLSVVEDALQSAIDTSDYLEAPMGSMAVAAAEVVAALKGKPRAELPPEVSEWVKAREYVVKDDLAEAARKAVAEVKNAESSELAQLWSESDELAEVWHADLRDLLQRLE